MDPLWGSRDNENILQNSGKKIQWVSSPPNTLKEFEQVF